MTILNKIFNQNMDQYLYLEILANFLVPFLAANYSLYNGILHQDNDPKHTSKKCIEFLNESGVKWIKSPSKSPDLNPIEMLWHEMKEFIRKRFCQTPEEVVFAILDWCDTITQEKCKKYIDHLPMVIKTVIKNKGGWSNS